MAVVTVSPSSNVEGSRVWPQSSNTLLTCGSNRDVVSVHLGQAGVQIGAAVWELYNHEHRISPEGEMKVPSKSQGMDDNDGICCGTLPFYRQLNFSNYFEPRAVFADLDPTVIDKISCSKLSKMIQPDYLVKGSEDAANNFARGYLAGAKTVLPILTDTILKQTECSDNHQGFMLFHSMGGGTGSGLGSRVLEYLAEEFPKKAVLAVAVYPSPKTSDAVVEPYNTILACHTTANLPKCVIYTDNEALYNLKGGTSEVYWTKNSTANNILSQAVSSVTSGMRCNTGMRVDLYDYQTNLIPFPRLHYPVMSLFPVCCDVKLDWSVSDITTKVLSPSYRLAEFSDVGKHLARCLLYRGDVSSSEIHETVSTKKKVPEILSWMNGGMKLGMADQPPCVLLNDKFLTVKRTACFVSNNSGLRSSWATLATKFRLLMSKGAFLHWYLGEGMEMSCFNEALETVEMLIDEYQAVSE